LYTFLPIFLWRIILLRSEFWAHFYEAWSSHKCHNSLSLVALLAGVECLVLGFTYRWIYSLLLIAYSVYLAASLNTRPDQANFKYMIITSSLCLAAFPLLPGNNTPNSRS
jgi:hypothetical protein